MQRQHHIEIALDDSHLFDDDEGDHDHGHGPHTHPHGHSHSVGHGRTHGLVDRSIVRSRAGIRAVSISFAVLLLTAFVQVTIFAVSGSVALLADLIHNFGDALTAVPLGIAFVLRSLRGEKLAGLAVVLAIFVSACVALYETIQRLIHPQDLSHLWVLAAAGLVGFAGNEFAAQIRLRAGQRLSSPALIADGNMPASTASSRSASSPAPSPLHLVLVSVTRSSGLASRS